ncbi:5167_t:CDS:2, partial [Racocetra persica]
IMFRFGEKFDNFIHSKESDTLIPFDEIKFRGEICHGTFSIIERAEYKGVKLKMSIDIAKGLLECHDHKIIHLKINSENILVDKNLELKIAGFGFITTRKFDNIETLRWAAPEYISGNQEMNKEMLKLSNIYSCGLVMWEIAVNGRKPYDGMNDDEIKGAKASGNVNNLIKELELEDVPGKLKCLIKKCCDLDPSKRAALEDVVVELKQLRHEKLQKDIKNDSENRHYFISRRKVQRPSEELSLIEPHHYVKLGKVISPPKLSSNEIRGNVAAVLPYIRQKVKMWGVDIVKAENFYNILINYDEEVGEFSDDESRLSRFDCIATLFALSECAVVQDIFQTMSQFPIAFPLLIPELDKMKKYKVMLPLFTGQVIKWETSNGTIVENHLFKDSFKMIVAVRIGTNPKGKSTIINQLMNSKYMFTSCSEPRAEYGIPYMISGSIEFVWLTEETCGDALWNMVFKNYYGKGEKDIILLANLHGDALDYPDQIEFLNQFPSCFMVYLMPGYNQIQKDKIKILISPKKAIYNYVDSSDANIKKYTINTNSLEKYETIKKVCKIFKEALTLNFELSTNTINANGLKIGKTLQLSGNTEFLESLNYIVGFVENKTCRYIKLNVMQLQKKQFNDISKCIQFWHQTTELQKLIRNFISILELPINIRKQALTRLEREISRISMKGSSKSRNDAISKRKELNSASIINTDQEKDKEIRKEIAKLWEEVDNKNLGIEHFFRELGHIYKIFIPVIDNGSKIISVNGLTKENILKLPEYCADLLISGNTIELLDGDSTTISEAWFLAICNCINEKHPKLKVFVISILGLQSSGKSTLLNALFACKFAVSVARCTKGFFMQLLLLEKELSDQLGVDAFILIDTEGLESTRESTEILQIAQTAIVTMARIKKVGMSPDILIVQHVTKKNAINLSVLEQKFCEAFQKSLEIAKEKDSEMGAHNFEWLSSLNARIKNKELLKLFAPFKNGATAYSPPSNQYHEDIVDLYNSIINDFKNSQ